jgi:lipopolysaccharide heptosyltransferase II
VLTRAKLEDFWKMVPEVDAVIPCGQNESVFAVAKKIRAGFDMAVVFPNSIRSALEVYLAKIPRRAGNHGKYRRWLLTSIFSGRMKQGPPRHQMHHYLDLVEFAGATVDESMRRIDSALHAAPLPAPAENPIPRVKIGLCPGAEYGRAKRWLPERFAEVVNAVSQRRECEWMLFGTVRDTRVGEEITGRLEGDFTNLIGKTTLAELIAALSECRLLLTNDTGTMHLAAFLGVPTVSIFGSTEPALTGPLGSGNRVLRHHVECSPCFLRDCPIDFRCMQAVTTGEVVEAVLRMLDA